MGMFAGQVVWITGGGSGLGAAMAREFVDQGAKVAISGRRVARLEGVVSQLTALGHNAVAVPCDVTDADSVQQAVASVVAHFGKMDVCVANAGFAVSGTLDRVSERDWRQQLDVNVVGAASTLKHALPAVREQSGRLAVVGSVAGLAFFPGAGVYQASKAAVRAMSHTFSMELAGTGVSCTLLQPGFVESEIGQVDNDGVFHPERTDQRPQKIMWSSADAARVMVRAIYKRRVEYSFTGHGRLGAFLGQHFPWFLRLVGQQIRQRSGM